MPDAAPILVTATLDAHADAHHASASAIRFRELKEAFKTTWTDKQKVEKWNDLLDRSEKAGGTLYVGVGGLLSDTVSVSEGRL